MGWYSNAETRDGCACVVFQSAFVLAAIVLAGLPRAASAGGGPRDVAVVINTRSAESREVGRYYQQARGIPESNIITISCPNKENVSGKDCERWIVGPLRQFLGRPEVAGRIDYIVLTKGVPLSADYGDPSGPHSVASVLTCLDHPEFTSTLANPYGPVAWQTWRFIAPEVAWSHSLDFNGYHFYLVTRLDAFTVDQVKALIDRSKQAALDGSFALDRGTATSGAYGVANDRLGDLAGSAYDGLVHTGHEVYFDSGDSFIANKCGLMGYFSWGSNDVNFDFSKYVSNQFVPGSIGDSYCSYSGWTFEDPGTTNRGSLMADLIPQGLCGAGAYVSEPQVTTATYANVLFDRYTKGYNMAESFYAACPQLYWKTVVVGDPLMAPYATPPVVSVSFSGQPLSGVVTITADCTDASGIEKVEFYFDDQLIGAATQAPYSVQLDTREYAIGAHAVEAIAYEDSPVGTQGSARQEVIVDNPVSAVQKIRETFDYPDDQLVRIDGKVVTAGTQEIGGAFYIEETDRSSAIKVITDQAVDRGDVVSLVGAMTTVAGVRAIGSSTVTITASGADVPLPLMMRLHDLGGAGIGSYTPPIGVGFGARNVGLLVRVAGVVTSVEPDAFHLNDSSVDTPVTVRCPGAALPAVGSWVAVTGLSESEYSAPEFKAAIRARGPGDVQVLN